MRRPGHANITQTIVDDLGSGIVTGRFDNTPFPSEQALADTYGAARTVTREAVKMLAAKGLISSRPKLGIRIEPEDTWNLLDADVLDWLLQRDFSIDTVIEFTQFRLGIEPNAARLAALNAGDAAKAELADIIRQMYAAEAAQEDSLEADIAFHVAILSASGNRFCRQMRDFISIALTYAIRRSTTLAGPHVTAAAEHETVARAIIAGDADGAERAMHTLIASALNLMHSDTASV